VADDGEDEVRQDEQAESDRDVARLDRLAAELVTDEMDVIVSASNPVGNGFVRSLRQPGGNIKGRLMYQLPSGT